ncbi:hypothetical protein [Collimonas silvisoli]|uniref:hypothetical protein n=1 Tax=Collimonas silvisoli TaxID=2825884 RepID=UPI001B8AC247|nr:hypothetical protein [Collimonas silvisoli]
MSIEQLVGNTLYERLHQRPCKACAIAWLKIANLAAEWRYKSEKRRKSLTLADLRAC